MEESVAQDVVNRLRARDVFAHVNRRVGVYSVGVRVVLPGGREAIWDNDGAAGLEAVVLQDGDLVGYVPQLPDSDDLDAAAIAHIIGAADYDASPAAEPAHPTAGTSATGGGPSAAGTAVSFPAPPSAPVRPAPSTQSAGTDVPWWRRWRRRP